MEKRTCRLVNVAAVLLSFLSFVTDAHSEIIELRGVGSLPAIDMQPAGVPGEDITVSVVLNSNDFIYVPVANPLIHYFAPTTTVPVNIVGSISGAYPNVSPVGRCVALELEESLNQGDLIELDVASGTNGTSLFSLSTDDASGFDGDLTPYNSLQLFALLETAVKNDALWQASGSSAVFVGSEELLFLGELKWSFLHHITGDFDSDGDVDGRDFLQWQRNPGIGNLDDWQAGYVDTRSVATAEVLPEPSGVLLWAFGALAASQRWVRSASSDGPRDDVEKQRQTFLRQLAAER